MADSDQAPGSVGVRNVVNGRNVAGIYLGADETVSDFVQWAEGITGNQLITYDGSGRIEFVGTLKHGGLMSESVCRIQKLFYDGGGNLIRATFAVDDPAFVHVWNDRASLSYPDGT